MAREQYQKNNKNLKLKPKILPKLTRLLPHIKNV